MTKVSTTRWLVGAAAVLALCALPAAAASKKKVCKQSCASAIESCTTTTAAFGYGDLAKGCAKSVLKRCKKEGPEVCTTFVPPGCGNGRRDLDEVCDGADLGGATCESLGFDGGTLACSSACVFDGDLCANDPV
jgi:hypothetical protein